MELLLKDEIQGSSFSERRQDSVFCRVATLGPSGTSSELAAQNLLGKFASDTELFSTFEAAANWVVTQNCNDCLLVPNAYADINVFYISQTLRPFGCFFFDTPPYVLASQAPNILNKENLLVGSHPAPSHLIQAQLPSHEVTVVPTLSTSDAAKKAAQSKVDLCLTTLPASQLHNLHVIKHATRTIEMLWTVFVKRMAV